MLSAVPLDGVTEMCPLRGGAFTVTTIVVDALTVPTTAVNTNRYVPGDIVPDIARKFRFRFGDSSAAANCCSVSDGDDHVRRGVRVSPAAAVTVVFSVTRPLGMIVTAENAGVMTGGLPSTTVTTMDALLTRK